MTDWIEHDGGPQPVGDDVWVEFGTPDAPRAPWAVRMKAHVWNWRSDTPYGWKWRILNQHLIDAARLEGIRLGLEAAAKEVEDIPGLRNFQRENALNLAFMAIRTLDPTTIAREATLDTLTAEAQANNMGYDQ